jgi:hypothetical protein
MRQISNSTQLLVSIFFFIVLFSTTSSALEFGATPSELKIVGNIDEESCESIRLFSSGDVANVFVSDFWSSEQSKNINDYTLYPSEVDLNSEYDTNVIVDSEGNFIFCVTPYTNQERYGVILFEIEDSNIVLGVWVDVVVYEEKSFSFRSITGSTIGQSSANSFTLGIMLSFILLVVLVYLIIRARRKFT